MLLPLFFSWEEYKTPLQRKRSTELCGLIKNEGGCIPQQGKCIEKSKNIVYMEATLKGGRREEPSESLQVISATCWGEKQPWLPEGSTHSKEYQCLVCVCAYMCVCVCVCMCTRDHTNYISSDSSVHGISQERILEWGCHFLFQQIFLTQGLNLCLLHWQADSLPLSYQGNLKVLNIRKLLQAHRIILYVN